MRHNVAITDCQVIDLPAAGELLSVATARDEPNTTIDVWSVDYEAGQPMRVEIWVFGTGNPISGEAEEAVLAGNFLGTVVTPASQVWHIWQGRTLAS
ncbi:DUF7352 domain-containing protein [Mycolicibacterium goodii]|uniref:DUF7352 domain-containing protein n=1 Tax=Mycolicibacterium goodii TaxID=134601 RepID=UPI001BDD60E6|nr:hypothetical protein [Mycolicibacterium goodii]MBU8834155.1 hypothetical protein [Mycolicibacterium goodii]